MASAADRNPPKRQRRYPIIAPEIVVEIPSTYPFHRQRRRDDPDHMRFSSLAPQTVFESLEIFFVRSPRGQTIKFLGAYRYLTEPVNRSPYIYHVAYALGDGRLQTSFRLTGGAISTPLSSQFWTVPTRRPKRAANSLCDTFMSARSMARDSGESMRRRRSLQWARHLARLPFDVFGGKGIKLFAVNGLGFDAWPLRACGGALEKFPFAAVRRRAVGTRWEDPDVGRLIVANSSDEAMNTDRLVAKYYRLPDGSRPVREFIDALPAAEQVLVENFIDRVNVFCTLKNPDLPEPHSRQIEGELRELRPKAKGNRYRILYRRSERMVILLHIFRKSTEKTPEAEKRIARNRWDDFKARIDADTRVRPSPIDYKQAP